MLLYTIVYSNMKAFGAYSIMKVNVFIGIIATIKPTSLGKIFFIRLCIHEKWSAWDYGIVLRGNRLFKGTLIIAICLCSYKNNALKMSHS